jgi:hypothetical protein
MKIGLSHDLLLTGTVIPAGAPSAVATASNATDTACPSSSTTITVPISNAESVTTTYRWSPSTALSDLYL